MVIDDCTPDAILSAKSIDGHEKQCAWVTGKDGKSVLDLSTICFCGLTNVFQKNTND